MINLIRWLGRWEKPMAREGEIVRFVPAVNAKGYQFGAPVYAQKSVDLKLAPQLRLWLEDAKK